MSPNLGLIVLIGLAFLAASIDWKHLITIAEKRSEA